METITSDELAAEIANILEDKTATPKQTAIGTVGTVVVVVGGYFIVRRWVDNRIRRQIRKNEK